jgi:hypothetical protein
MTPLLYGVWYARRLQSWLRGFAKQKKVCIIEETIRHLLVTLI